MLQPRTCERCGGRLTETGDPTELSCANCGNVVYLDRPLKPISGGSGGNGPLLEEPEKSLILDALSEQYLRAVGNIRRSQLSTTRRLNESKASMLSSLMEKVKGL